MIGTLVRVEGEEIVSPELGHAQPSASTEAEDASLAVVRSIHIARVDESCDLIDLEAQRETRRRRHSGDQWNTLLFYYPCGIRIDEYLT